MGKIDITINVENGSVKYSANWDGASQGDLAAAIVQLEKLKLKLLDKVKGDETEY